MISKRLVRTILRLSISIVIIGVLFKIMHWPYSSTILLVGLGSILVFYPVRFYLKSPKIALDYSKLGLVMSFVLHFSFRIFHWPYGYIFTITTLIAVAIFVVLYFKDVFVEKGATKENKTSKTTKISYVLYSIAGVGIIAGALFKIMHWPYGNEFLIFGLLFAAVSVFIGSREFEE